MAKHRQKKELHKSHSDEETNDDLRRVAYHEAGHAVTAVLLKRTFKYATIVADDTSLGHVSYVKKGLPNPEDLIEEQEIARAMKKMDKIILTALGGRAAEEIFFETQSLLCSRDWDQAVQLSTLFYPPGDLLDAYLRYQLERCKAMLSKPLHRRFVKAVAELLEDKKHVSAKDIRVRMNRCREEILETVAKTKYTIIRSQ